MKLDFDEIFPEGMTDQSAWIISHALHLIAGNFEVSFMEGIMRENLRRSGYEASPERPSERLK